MSKNLTRKGIAFGATFALAATAFAGATPASAAVEGFVTLAPTSGYAEAYATLAGAGNDFSLTATQGPSAIFTNKELKFLVTDPESKFEPAVTQTAKAGPSIDQTTTGQTTFKWVNASDKLEIIADGSALKVGDSIVFSQKLETAIVIYVPVSTAVEVTAINSTTSFTVQAPAQDTADVSSATVFAGTDATSKVVRNARAADGSFVVDTGVTNGAATALVLKAVDGENRSVTAQAFVDYVENDKIDSLDYVSPERTLTFVKKADVAIQATLTTPVVGATALTATLVTSPLLNGAETGSDETILGAIFNRQSSAVTAIVPVNVNSQSTVTGSWTASVNTAVATSFTKWTDATTDIASTQTWGFANAASGAATALSISASGLVTVTRAAHNLRTGDTITMAVAIGAGEDPTVSLASETASKTITVTGPDTFTYQIAETTGITAATDSTLNAGTAYTITTNGSGVEAAERVFAGDYSAQAVLYTAANRWKAVGTASTFTPQVVAADDTVFTTAASAGVQASRVLNTTDTTTDSLLKTGTLTAVATATIVDDLGVAVGAGRSVAWAISAGAAGTIKVNGKTISDTLLPLTTDANGQVTFTVTDTTGSAGKKVTFTATPEGVSGAATSFTFEWADAALSLYDLGTSNNSALATGSRTIAAGSSYDLNVFVADQWFTPAADADYRLAVSGSGVTEGVVSLVSGKATVKVKDNGVSTSFVSNLTLQKKGTTGVFANTTTTVALTNNTVTSSKVALAADAVSLYASATADLSDLVAAKALVERDVRSAFVAKPVYTNDVVVTGKVANGTSGASQAYSVVTVSGSSSILFSNGAVDKRGSITLVADSNGEFVVNLYSTTTLTDSVVTVTANGVSSTVKVSFTGIGVGEGTSLTATAPSKVAAASTFQVSAKLADAYGNGVAATAGRVKVTYTGAGIVFGTLPDKTDATGALSFSALLGAADKGLVTVTVQYDQNGDADFVDAKDLTVVKNILVGVSASASAGIKKANVVVKNASGLSVTVVSGTKSVTKVATSNSYKLSLTKLTKGSKTVKVYVNDILVASKKVSVK
jgi:hypothetical protein